MLKRNKARRQARKVRLVESSIQRVARMLSQQYGIRVEWSSTGKCYTNGKVIVLPALPDNAPDALLEAVHGYLDHETAHVLFTDFENKKAKSLDPVRFSCVNAVEDIRIERKLGTIFPGSPYNLRKAHEWMLIQFEKHWDKLNQFAKAICGFITYCGYGDTEFWQDYVDEKTKDLVRKGIEAVGSFDAIQSTADSVEAGLRLYKVLEEFAEEEKQEREEREKDQQSSGSQSGTEQQEQAQFEPGICGISGTLTQVSKEVIEATATGKVVKLPDGTLYEHDQESDSTYLIWDTSLDIYEQVTTQDEYNLRCLRDEAADLTHVMRTRLVNSIRASAQRRWVSGKEEGKLDSRRLHRAILGLGDDVFKQRVSKPSMNTVVGLAIDHSGSMYGDRIELAAESAIVIGDVLHALKVPFYAYGYSTRGYAGRPSNSALYARWNGLWIGHYHSFGGPWEQGALRLASARHNIRQNTLDGESVKYGIQQLLLRPEQRKVLFVFNDGAPYPGRGHTGRCQEYLHDIVAASKKAGVEVIAFGIQDDSVKHYYDNYVVIHNLQDLVKEPLQVLDTMLRKGISLR